MRIHRYTRFGILLLLASSPAWSQLSGVPVSSPALAVTSPLPHAPRKVLGPAPNQWASNIQIFESSNWSGYAVIGTGFTQARGSWTVPSVDCAVNPNGAASFWVGIDGWDNDTVEQTGTEAQCNGDKPVYYAWYEFAPLAGVTVTSVPVSPDDKMSGEVDYNGSEFVVTITNLTTGDSYTTSKEFPEAKRTSAEWIAESNGNTGLPDFDAVRFGPDFTQATGTNDATDSTTSGSISAFTKDVQASILAFKNKDEAVPSFLSSDGTSFIVTYWKP
jgi:hypothetical protein